MSSMPPGWYPDPWRLVPARWWDGYQWTGHAAPGGGVANAVAAQQRAELISARKSEHRLLPWARAALYGWALVVVGQLAAGMFATGGVRDSFRKLFHQLQTAQPGQTVPAPDLHGFLTLNAILDGAQFVTLLVGVVFMIWQYHAATVAGGLGYPAARTPGLGVGSWFIPIVMFWFPYQALRDCLPPGHSARVGSGWVWVAFLVTGFLSSVTIVVGIFSQLAALIPLVPAVALLAFVVVRGPQLVQAVEDDHARAVESVETAA